MNLGGFTATAEDITSGSDKEWMEYAVGMKGGDTYTIPLRYFRNSLVNLQGCIFNKRNCSVGLRVGWEMMLGVQSFDADVIIIGFEPSLNHNRSVMGNYADCSIDRRTAQSSV